MSSGVKSEVARGHNFDEHHEHSNVKTVKLSGKNVQPKTNYAVGVLSQGVLHLTPLSAVCRFRPQLNYIDEAQAAAAASSEAAREAHRAERLMSGRMTEEEELEAEEEEYARVKAEEEKKQLQTVVMKVERKRAGAAASAAGGAGGAAGAPGAAGAAPGVGAGGTMRKQTYAYIKQLEESEKWIPLKMHEQDVSVYTCACAAPPDSANRPCAHRSLRRMAVLVRTMVDVACLLCCLRLSLDRPPLRPLSTLVC
jgi:hypothetical protein